MTDPAVECSVRDAVPHAVSALVRSGVPFADAEDAVQEAVMIALEKWPSEVPTSPVGWLVRVARRRHIARHRTDSARSRREAIVAAWSERATEPIRGVDDTLILITMCCHPAITPASAVALTLRAVGGLTTREIADALLQPESTIAQRISRAKATITASGEPFGRPDGGAFDPRLAPVLQVIYLIFNEGHATTEGPALTRADLCDEAIRLARQLHLAAPGHPEAAGLLALLLLTDARRAARTSPDGELIPLDEQDRTRWDRAGITEGLTVLTRALGQHQLGEYQLLASIAALHDQAPTYADTDWDRIVALYDRLAARGDNPMVELSRAVAVAHARGVEAARAALQPLATRLADHHRYHAVVGHLAELADDIDGARTTYAVAARLATNDAERRHLERKAGRR